MNKCLNKNCEKLTKNPKFCSSSCAAVVNNNIHIKRVRKIFKCKQCSSEVKYKRRFCNKECEKTFRNNKIKPDLLIMNKKLKDVKQQSSEHQNKFVHIRSSARIIYDRFGLPKRCKVCEYDKHIHICHIKAISDFSDEALVSEINNIDNLVALCPNHHWEFDNNLITL